MPSRIDTAGNTIKAFDYPVTSSSGCGGVKVASFSCEAFFGDGDDFTEAAIINLFNQSEKFLSEYPN